ncbi:GPW/gp25 family protein [Fulvivirga sp. M361]|uniref:GPW/gp25 family protein n=1 Tax=Fulvivirga sp. M361 TaxID=2594266 RepID=UPI00117A716C|nr:GPW/gp25 family protein [Fulvivirga sp. M361]TRX58266.1 GPW/gp25 family protein [Fulvivirga sp. M361]
MKHKKTFLGIGWKFPPSFDKRTGSVVLVSEEEDIRESLLILLSTKPGERVMLPDYGCDLTFSVFESIDSTLINEIKRKIEFSVLYYEPRIILDDIKIEPDTENDGLLMIELIYIIRKTNKRSNMVYPYYIIEGTDVRFKPQVD